MEVCKEERLLCDELANMTRQARYLTVSANEGPQRAAREKILHHWGVARVTNEGNNRHDLYANTTVHHFGIASSPWHPS